MFPVGIAMGSPPRLLSWCQEGELLPTCMPSERRRLSMTMHDSFLSRLNTPLCRANGCHLLRGALVESGVERGAQDHWDWLLA